MSMPHASAKMRALHEGGHEVFEILSVLSRYQDVPQNQHLPNPNNELSHRRVRNTQPHSTAVHKASESREAADISAELRLRIAAEAEKPAQTPVDAMQSDSTSAPVSATSAALLLLEFHSAELAPDSAFRSAKVISAGTQMVLHTSNFDGVGNGGLFMQDVPNGMLSTVGYMAALCVSNRIQWYAWYLRPPRDAPMLRPLWHAAAPNGTLTWRNALSVPKTSKVQLAKVTWKLLNLSRVKEENATGSWSRLTTPSIISSSPHAGFSANHVNNICRVTAVQDRSKDDRTCPRFGYNNSPIVGAYSHAVSYFGHSIAALTIIDTTVSTMGWKSEFAYDREILKKSRTHLLYPGNQAK
ncbi:hypothetical protein K438DRAFT_1765817 [Mycena galopus ATCC 62051]|nr:hypothetical protein K438DRAFT_1765817 [Mycena galopus ATCC 62051]